MLVKIEIPTIQFSITVVKTLLKNERMKVNESLDTMKCHATALRITKLHRVLKITHVGIFPVNSSTNSMITSNFY